MNVHPSGEHVHLSVRTGTHNYLAPPPKKGNCDFEVDTLTNNRSSCSRIRQTLL